MPHFYFHVFNGNGETRDDEGVELRDLDEARTQAMVGIRSILRDELMAGMVDLSGVLRVTDDADHVLLEIRFDEAVEIRHCHPSRQMPAGGDGHA